MKILKEDENNKLSINDVKGKLSSVYNDLAGIIIDNPQAAEAIARIMESIYVIDEQVLQRGDELKNKILKGFNISDGDILTFLSKITPEDAKIVFSGGKKFTPQDSGDLKNTGLSNRLFNYAFNYIKQGIGKGEVLLTLLGGSKPKRGDINFGNIGYELKNITKKAAYNQGDDDFNMAVDKLFKELFEKSTKYNNQGALDINYIKERGKEYTKQDILNEINKLGIKDTLGNINFDDSVGLFKALALEAARRACLDNSGGFLLINGTKYKVMKPSDIFNSDSGVNVIFESSQGNSKNRCFKLLANENW